MRSSLSTSERERLKYDRNVTTKSPHIVRNASFSWLFLIKICQPNIK